MAKLARGFKAVLTYAIKDEAWGIIQIIGAQQMIFEGMEVRRSHLVRNRR
jgi:hypothetical protein